MMMTRSISLFAPICKYWHIFSVFRYKMRLSISYFVFINHFLLHHRASLRQLTMKLVFVVINIDQAQKPKELMLNSMLC